MIDFTEKLKQKGNEELANLYVNAKDYQPEFIVAVIEEMKQRNMNIENYQSVKNKIEEYAYKKSFVKAKASNLELILGFVSAFLGGFFAIGIGYYFAYSKRKDANNEKVYTYTYRTRIYGKWMMGIGIVFFILYLLAYNNK